MSAASGEVNKQSRNVENNLSKILIGSRIFEFSCLLMQYATHYRILKTKNQENLDYATETQICLTMLSRTRIGLGLYWEICYDSWRWRCISYSLFGILTTWNLCREMLVFNGDKKGSKEELELFTDTLNVIRRRHLDTVPRMAAAVFKMTRINSSEGVSDTVQYFLDRLYINR